MGKIIGYSASNWFPKVVKNPVFGGSRYPGISIFGGFGTPKKGLFGPFFGPLSEPHRIPSDPKVPPFTVYHDRKPLHTPPLDDHFRPPKRALPNSEVLVQKWVKNGPKMAHFWKKTEKNAHGLGTHFSVPKENPRCQKRSLRILTVISARARARGTFWPFLPVSDHLFGSLFGTHIWTKSPPIPH